jgi:hypothetical protein
MVVQLSHLLATRENQERWYEKSGLAVEPQQVVPGETESADRRSGTDTAMRPVPVVAVKPSRQFGCTFV